MIRCSASAARVRLGALGALGIFVGGCFYEWDGATSATSGTGGGATGSAQSGGGLGGGGLGGGTGPGGTSASSSSGAPCGGCEQDAFCDFFDHLCGEGSAGECVAAPAPGCTETGPVCGCDGNRYPASCDAYAAGVDLGVQSACPFEGAEFACGYRLCAIDKQFCEHTISGSKPEIYECPERDPGCTAGCSCLSLAPGCICDDSDQNLVVTCTWP